MDRTAVIFKNVVAIVFLMGITTWLNSLGTLDVLDYVTLLQVGNIAVTLRVMFVLGVFGLILRSGWRILWAIASEAAY